MVAHRRWSILLCAVRADWCVSCGALVYPNAPSFQFSECHISNGACADLCVSESISLLDNASVRSRWNDVHGTQSSWMCASGPEPQIVDHGRMAHCLGHGVPGGHLGWATATGVDIETDRVPSQRPHHPDALRCRIVPPVSAEHRPNTRWLPHLFQTGFQTFDHDVCRRPGNAPQPRAVAAHVSLTAE